MTHVSSMLDYNEKQKVGGGTVDVERGLRAAGAQFLWQIINCRPPSTLTIILMFALKWQQLSGAYITPCEVKYSFVCGWNSEQATLSTDTYTQARTLCC